MKGWEGCLTQKQRQGKRIENAHKALMELFRALDSAPINFSDDYVQEWRVLHRLNQKVIAAWTKTEEELKAMIEQQKGKN